jgi:translation initiation factor 1A
MPAKNKGKGGKHKRKGKKRVEPTVALKFTRKAEGKFEKYGKIVKLMGDCRISVETPDNCSYVCHIPGKFRKRVWMKVGDIVLFSLRPFDKPVSAVGATSATGASSIQDLDFSQINTEMSIEELSDFYIVLAR